MSNEKLENANIGETAKLNKWSQGAFLLGGIWGLFNGVYWPIIVIVPLCLLDLVIDTHWFGIVVTFVEFAIFIYLGSNGRSLAWKNKKWESVEKFCKVQRGWDIAGFIVLGSLILALIILFCLLFAA